MSTTESSNTSNNNDSKKKVTPEERMAAYDSPLDHFSQGKLVYKSSICLIPPLDKWEQIQRLRKVHDKHFLRWMPHINLLYGFFVEADFEQFIVNQDNKQLLEDHLRQHLFEGDHCVSPFEMKLTEMSYFTHGKRSSTVWAAPEVEDNALVKLQSNLEQAFPQCTEQGSKSESGFTPHLSIGQTKGEKKAKSLIKDNPWEEETMDIDSVFWITRQSFEDPFRVRGIISLDKDAETIFTPVSLDDDNEMNAVIMELNKEFLENFEKEQNGKGKGKKQDKQPKKAKMRGAEDVISRIHHDAAFADFQWTIGYEDRFDGIKEISMALWDEGPLKNGLGSIPMHRIRYFKANDDIVWDRRDKTDNVFGENNFLTQIKSSEEEVQNAQETTETVEISLE